MDKKYHVLWTGGLDSTALVCSLLEQGYEVKVSYVEIHNNEEQYKRELDAIHTMQDLLMEKDELNLISTINGNNTNVNVFLEDDQPKINFAMMPMFVMHMLYSYDPDYTFALAYVSNDDFIGYTEEFKEVMSKFLPFFRYDYGAHAKLTPDNFNIEFPLIKISKPELINYLKEFGGEFFGDEYEILNKITYCESAYDEDFCGICTCCERMKNDARDLFVHQQSVYGKNKEIKDLVEKKQEEVQLNGVD